MRSYARSLEARAAAELELRRRAADAAGTLTYAGTPEAEALEAEGWQTWLSALFGPYVRAGFAQRHIEFWSWVWAIELGLRPPPFIGIWGRGGGKSTSAELATVSVGARGVRAYVLYICETQPQADEHVSNVASMLESGQVERYYPDLAQRRVGKYGSSKGWRREQLRTGSGFNVAGIGLDVARRGAKLDGLKGIWPGALTYEIIRPSRHPLTAADLKAAGEAIAPLKKSGLLVEELLLQFLAKTLPGLDPEEALRLLKEQQAEEEKKRQAILAQTPPPGQQPPNGQQPPAPAPQPEQKQEES
jgi:hypothetical protein